MSVDSLGEFGSIADDGYRPRLVCADEVCLVTWEDRFGGLVAATWHPGGDVIAPVQVDNLQHWQRSVYDVRADEHEWRILVGFNDGDVRAHTLTRATAPRLDLPWSRPASEPDRNEEAPP